MLAGALTMGVSFWLLLSPPGGLETPALFGWLVLSTLLFRSTSALFRVPYLSLGAEMSQDYDERTAIVGARSVFGLLGTLAAGWLSFAAFGPSGFADPVLAPGGYSGLGLAFGALMTVCGLATVAGTLGYRTWPVGDPAGGGIRAVVGRAREALGNRHFRAVWITVTLFFLGVVLNASVALHYFTWYVRIADPQVVGRTQGLFYGGALVGVFLWVRAAARAEKRPLAVAALVLTAVPLALATLLFGAHGWFGTGSARPLMAGYLLAGLAAAALWVLPGSMLADVADDDERETGERREGLFFGLLNLGEKVGAGLALLAAGLLLEHVVGLTPGVAPAPAAVARLGWVFGVVPAGVLCLAAWQLRAYGLDRAAVGRIQATLAALRPSTSSRRGDGVAQVRDLGDRAQVGDLCRPAGAPAKAGVWSGAPR
jgi:GPH family glycoside/pentoside/hexuronide:cation symporter